MSKLQRSVEGQTIQFIPLPRIFQSLSSDLPSGGVPLPNGDVAYWRLHRNVTELKRQRKNVRELSLQLAQAFKALVNSDAFRNHYGLTAVPAIPAEQELVQTFRNLLSINNNRVSYETISHGNKKPLVETLTVPMGNLVFLNAYRGLQDPPKTAGVKGKLWLTESADDNQFFKFTIVSPTLKLPDYISAERLKTELLGKLKLNLPIMVHNPRLVFDDGQFDNFLNNQLSALASQHPAAANGKQKQKNQKVQNSSVSGTDASVQSVKATDALHRESFEELDEIGRMAYLGSIREKAEAGKKEDRSTLIAYLVSGILETQWGKYNEAANPKATLSYFLALTAGIGEKQFKELMGESEELYLARIPARIGVPYRVISGDTLWALAVEAYGDGELWGLIHEANKGAISDPDMIFPGQELDIPALDQGAAAIETIDYTVQEGDTAKTISQEVYGTDGYWGDILSVNPGVFGEDGSVAAGTAIQLPVIQVDHGTEEVLDEGTAVDDSKGVPADDEDEANVPYDYARTGSVGDDPEDLPVGSVEGIEGLSIGEVKEVVQQESHPASGLLESLAETLVVDEAPAEAAVELPVETTHPAVLVADEEVLGEELVEAKGLSAKTFLETHDAANFAEGSFARLLTEDATDLFKVVNKGGVWYFADQPGIPLAEPKGVGMTEQ